METVISLLKQAQPREVQTALLSIFVLKKLPEAAWCLRQKDICTLLVTGTIRGHFPPQADTPFY
jgi:hypothetical protein